MDSDIKNASVFQQDMAKLQEFKTSIPVKWKTRNDIYESIPKHGVGVELGVLHGVNADALYRITEPKTLYLIDAWKSKCIIGDPTKYTKFQERQEIRYKKVCRHFRALSKENIHVWRCYTTEALSAIEDGSLDWIYVDANHRFEAALMDIRTWTPKLKVGGYMMCHDFTLLIYNGGVIEAVMYAMRRPGELHPIGIDSERCTTVVLQKHGIGNVDGEDSYKR